MEPIEQRLGVTRRESKPGVATLTLLRVVAGIIMVAHGYQKLTGYESWRDNVANMNIPLPDLAAPLAIAGELGGGAGLLVGLLTPLSAVGVVATMLVAILSVHLPHGLFAKNNGFEYPLTMLCVALFFVFRGAGPISLDGLLTRQRSSSSGHVQQPQQRTAEQH